jgi:ABC-2 type transport system ATP-binding protein
VSEPASAPALRVRGLRKSFGTLVAVDGLDLDAPRGTCLAVLGPNGAGKTTTIEILEGLKRADAGEVEIFGLRWGRDDRRLRESIGVQLQETEFQDKLTPFDVLRLLASFYKEARTPDEVLELVGLTEKRDARIVTLSGGQKQRLALGAALINRPRILFLDEPTTGLDPQARRRVWEIVERFKEGGGTVLLTTHYMEEAERLAEEVVIVDHGRAIDRGSPASLISALGIASVIHFTPREGEAVNEGDLAGLPGVRGVRRDGGVVELSVASAQVATLSLFRWFEERGLHYEDLRTHRPTLEDVFVFRTGKHLRDG